MSASPHLAGPAHLHSQSLGLGGAIAASPEEPVGKFGERGGQEGGAAECSGGPWPIAPKGRQTGPKGPGEASGRELGAERKM